MNGSIVVSSDLEQRKYCSEPDRYSQCYLSGLSVCIRFSLYIINCTVYHQHFIFPKFRLGGRNFCKELLEISCQSTKVHRHSCEMSVNFCKNKGRNSANFALTILAQYRNGYYCDSIMMLQNGTWHAQQPGCYCDVRSGTDLELTRWPTTSFLDFSCLEHAQAPHEHSRQSTIQLGSVSFIDANIR